MITQLSKKKTKELELSSTRIENLHNRVDDLKLIKFLYQHSLIVS